jgi:L-lactate dehydrogenase complex protein LldG
MTTSRAAILDSLRRNRPAPADPPVIEHEWTAYTDPRAKFAEVLELVGGATVIAHGFDDLNRQLSTLPQFASAKIIASHVPGVGSTNINLSTITGPHELAGVDVAILPGEFAVAENAAVWVTDKFVPLRALYFICQHLVLVVPGDAVVDHMHAAYARLMGTNESPTSKKALPSQPPFAEPSFGTFISGPSKTADIEQSLVIGAHGPRSLVVCFLDR